MRSNSFPAGEVAQSINEQGDLISGGDGNDLIYGSNANDALFGGAGSDLLVGGGGIKDSREQISSWLIADSKSRRHRAELEHYNFEQSLNAGG